MDIDEVLLIPVVTARDTMGMFGSRTWKKSDVLVGNWININDHDRRDDNG